MKNSFTLSWGRAIDATAAAVGRCLVMRRHPAHSEFRTAIKFAAVGCIGLTIDAAVLQIGLWAGAPPSLARIVSLTCAMQATFLINGLLVFRCLDRSRCLRQWAAYMSSNGLGNACNFMLFVALVDSHAPVVSHRYVALLIGSLTAYLINYAGVRLLAFGRPRGARAMRKRLCDPGGEPAPAQTAPLEA